MREVLTIVLFTIFFVACKQKDNSDNNDFSKRIQTDTSHNYIFKSVSISKNVDDNIYDRLIIMDNKGGRFMAIDTMGYFRKEGKKIYYLLPEFVQLREKAKRNKYSYRAMNEQLFFDFSLKQGNVISFTSKCAFPHNNTIEITSINFDKILGDYIFSCKRIDSLSTSYQSDGGYFLQTFKIGEKVGFTEFVYKNYDSGILDVYVPLKGQSWNIWANVSE
jgi:hypothetical protein